MNANEKLWWFRYTLAIPVAVLSTILTVSGFFQEVFILNFFLAVFFYILTYPISIYILKITPDKTKSKRDLVLYGVFAYFISWFFFWILFYTLTKIM
ncbi:MAG: hypothetical protein N3E48_02715 [Candidatus Bathyarchaeota archaeon]|nr:hypothetical protein [Candidatus Bathyarchaeota archaeon]